MRRLLQEYSGTLYRGTRGNIAYRLQLPDGLASLSVVFVYQKEHLKNEKAYAQEHAGELRPILDAYLERTASDEELLHYVHGLKTELQLCVMIGGKFVGNVHMPGKRKEIFVTRTSASRGCIIPETLSGACSIIINLFNVIEDDTHYRLEVRGEFEADDSETADMNAAASSEAVRDAESAGSRSGETSGGSAQSTASSEAGLKKGAF